MVNLQSSKIPVACLAPPMTDGLLGDYADIIHDLPEGELKDTLLVLYKCVHAWWEVPESTEKPQKWRGYNATNGKLTTFSLIPLSEELKKTLYDSTPWMRELDTLSTSKGDGLFDSLTGEIRNVAFHLLWYAKELTLDREPISQDKLTESMEGD